VGTGSIRFYFAPVGSLARDKVKSHLAKCGIRRLSAILQHEVFRVEVFRDSGWINSRFAFLPEFVSLTDALAKNATV